jgi:alpha-galactosidase/6-phospho-beta-glucosidase family protein
LLALLAHPLVPSADVAERLLQRLIEANQGYWPVLK